VCVLTLPHGLHEFRTHEFRTPPLLASRLPYGDRPALTKHPLLDRFAVLALALAGLFSLLAACGDGSSTAVARSSGSETTPRTKPPSCTEVIRHIRALAPEDRPLDAADEEAWAKTSEASCTTKPWSDAVRRCIVAATTQDALADCERTERLARGDDLSGPDCEAVVAHNLELWRSAGVPGRDISGDPPRAALMRSCRTRSRVFKECVLASRTLADYSQCAAAEER